MHRQSGKTKYNISNLLARVGSPIGNNGCFPGCITNRGNGQNTYIKFRPRLDHCSGTATHSRGIAVERSVVPECVFLRGVAECCSFFLQRGGKLKPTYMSHSPRLNHKSEKSMKPHILISGPAGFTIGKTLKKHHV